MVITYYGGACLKAQSGETLLDFNPPSKESEFKSPRFQTNVIFINCNHKDYNGSDNLSGKRENAAPFLINSPGEYEIGGICVNGIFSGFNRDCGAVNTIYVLLFEDIVICHLGAFGEKELSPEAKQEIGNVDILFLPVSGGDGQKSAQIIAQIEPKIIIPIYAKESDLKQFLKEIGNGVAKPVDKLTLKKKDLSEKKNEIIVLEPCL